MTRHAIQILRKAGRPAPAVAAQVQVSERSVWRISQEPPVTTSDDQVLVRAHRVGRPSTVAAVEPRLIERLRQDAGLPGIELVRRAREAGYPGGKSALYELIRRLRPVTAGPVVRFEGVPGEFSQHDFGHVDVR
ncbi:MAG TPA: hypothetical protein VLA62_08985, partial [Solirubrobacterales bacterium]|nr:hypothetical protein [Solirubrobacterales bacterium]